MSQSCARSKHFTNELVQDPQQLLSRLVEIFGAEKLAQIVYAFEQIDGENGYGGIEIIFSDGRPQNIKAVISLR